MRCLITSPTGMQFVGENWCENPQEVCPRGPGEDYTKCKTVCRQQGHAEADAVRKAGAFAQGGAATLIGHTHACMDCQHQLFGAGILTLAIAKRPL